MLEGLNVFLAGKGTDKERASLSGCLTGPSAGSQLHVR